MKITSKLWGTLPDGSKVFRIELKNSNGMSTSVLTYGGIIQSVIVPDRTGIFDDIVLGYDTLEEYISDECYFGAMIGRVANRISSASFELDGIRRNLTANERGNTLHGGSGFHKKLWEHEILDDALLLKRLSPDGEDGFPGNLNTEIRICLSDENVLRIDFSAASDKTTICSMTSHSYFNLKGASSGRDVSGHYLEIRAAEYTPTGIDQTPTGEICSVRETPYDFLQARPVGSEALDGNLVLAHSGNSQEKDAVDACLSDPVSGRMLLLKTSLPGLQLYNGSQIISRRGKGGAAYGPGSGLCLEPQFFPDAVHHPHFPQPLLEEGETYRHFIEYRFDVASQSE